MTKQAFIALVAVAPLPVVAYLFGSDCFSGMFTRFMKARRLSTIGSYNDVVAVAAVLVVVCSVCSDGDGVCW